jgi:16S rRNA C1402 N4-methylase RsmH
MISFESKKKRLVKTYMEGLARRPSQAFLDLDDTKAKAFKPAHRKKAKPAA